MSYESLRQGFRWNLPASYNIGLDTCNKHAVNKGKLALIYDKDNGLNEKWTFEPEPIMIPAKSTITLKRER